MSKESGLYYLQSRYYDPELGRFINADAFASTGQGILGHNMFAYCRNNPVCREDASGTDDVRVTSESTEDGNPLNDIGTSFRPGGAGGGGNSSASSTNRTGGYSYSAPAGGGGISSQVKVGNVTVSFGHGGRHPTISYISGLENTIANDVVSKPPTTGYRGEYDITYNGTVFTYRYWTIDPLNIRIGTYFYKRPN